MTPSLVASNYDLAICSVINKSINDSIGFDPTVGWCDVTDADRRTASCKGYAISKINRAVREGVPSSSIFLSLCFYPFTDKGFDAPPSPSFVNHAFMLIDSFKGYMVATNGYDDLVALRDLKRQGWTNFKRYLHGTQPQILESFDITVLPDLARK